MLSIQFRSHLWFSPTHRWAAPYVIFILFIVSRSHPRLELIFSYGIGRSLCRTSFRWRHFRAVIFFLKTITPYNVCVRCGSVHNIGDEKLFGYRCIDWIDETRRVVCLNREPDVLKMGSEREKRYIYLEVICVCRKSTIRWCVAGIMRGIE